MLRCNSACNLPCQENPLYLSLVVCLCVCDYCADTMPLWRYRGGTLPCTHIHEVCWCSFNIHSCAQFTRPAADYCCIALTVGQPLLHALILAQQQTSSLWYRQLCLKAQPNEFTCTCLIPPGHLLQADVIPTCRELGIGIVAYSPLGRGFLTGTVRSVKDLHETDWRVVRMPRFQGENLEKVSTPLCTPLPCACC